MRNKILRIISLVLLCCIAVAAVVIFTMREDSNVLQSESYSVDIYFLNQATNRLEAESRTINAEDRVALVRSVAVALVTGPRNANLSRSIPEDVQIIAVNLLPGDTAEVNFSEEYNNMSSTEELFCRSAIVWTLTGLDFIENVIINVNGEPLRKSNGQEMGLLNRGNILIDPSITPEMTAMQTISLFFSDANGLWLVQEERTIEVVQNTPIERYVMEGLIAGPVSSEIFSFIPTTTQLLGIETIDGVCYVDLSREFVEQHSESPLEARLTMYSIVNSLANLPNIEQVVLKVEGVELLDFKEIIDLREPLEPDFSMNSDEIIVS